MKIIFFGSSSPLSFIPLQAIIKSHHSISAVVVKNESSSDFSVISPNTINSLAFSNTIPVLEYDFKSDLFVKQLSKLKADLILVSCFAYRIPNKILAIAKYGGINFHPSLLPSFRGPEPLFWQYRGGISNFGATLHRLTDDYDAGDIISQETVRLEDGISSNDATQKLAIKASDLILNSLQDIANNSATEIKQNPDFISYQSFPKDSDYSVSTSWTAKRIYNFIKAYKSTSVTFSCDVYGRTLHLSSANSYQSAPYPGMNGESVFYNKETVFFACKDSFIECETKNS